MNSILDDEVLVSILQAHILTEELGAYHEQTLSEFEQLRVESHLKKCPECQEQYDLMREILSSYHEQDIAPEHAQQLRELIEADVDAELELMAAGESATSSWWERLKARFSSLLDVFQQPIPALFSLVSIAALLIAVVGIGYVGFALWRAQETNRQASVQMAALRRDNDELRKQASEQTAKEEDVRVMEPVKLITPPSQPRQPGVNLLGSPSPGEPPRPPIKEPDISLMIAPQQTDVLLEVLPLVRLDVEHTYTLELKPTAGEAKPITIPEIPGPQNGRSIFLWLPANRFGQGVTAYRVILQRRTNGEATPIASYRLQVTKQGTAQ